MPRAPVPEPPIEQAPAPGPGRADVPEEPERPAIAAPARPEVQALVAEFSGPRSRSFAEALERGRRYLPMIRRILAEEGLPEELAFLPVVESHFRPDARSPAGALGLWQFIESTARLSGLRVDWWVDERLDPELSTRAAARHLRELFDQFQDWELALAAYNAGPGAVYRALSRKDAQGFWELCDARALRAETRRYVPKFHAAAVLAAEWAGGEGPGEDPWPLYDVVEVDAPVDLATVARLAGARVGEVRRLNPALLRGCTPPGEARYPVRVPAGRGEAVAAGLAEIAPAERLTFRRYRVQPGDTLWEVARRYGTRARAIAELNGVRSARRIRPGQELVLPVPAEGAEGKLAFKSPRVQTDTVGDRRVHVVRRGDTLWDIAREHGVTVGDLRAWNGLGRGAVIRPGDRLAVGPVPRKEDTAVAQVHVHVVREGDTLWGISRRYGVSVGDLREHNGLEPDAVLRPGDRIVVGPQRGDST
ncbi:MAG: lytic transglycosylase domain-containing protein [Deferrisomatales bacterium]